MDISRREFLKLSGSVAALGAFAGVRWSGAQTVAETSPELHLLKRLSWGVRPQDLARVRELGIEGYLDEQLAPWKLPDPELDAFLAEMPMLSMDEAALRQAVSKSYGDALRTATWARVYRALHSERQLFERMVEVWTDHFNVPIGDYIPEKFVEDREVIRRYALSSFRELLFASAQSPAMLLYLNNASSHKDAPNENYARELLELHTLGVDGGYSEEDVHNVARAFTGWTLRDGWPGRFFFDASWHDDGEKVVLGQVLGAGRGIEDGLQVLDLLATHPATARHISTKLCRHFVRDEPPEALIESSAEVFLTTDGDVPSLLRHIVKSDAFWASQDQKFRRPLEFVIAAVRTLQPSLVLDAPDLIYRRLGPMGQLPYQWQPPDGYPDTASAWINSNGLLHRWNFAMQLPSAAEEGFEGATLDLAEALPLADNETVGSLIDGASRRILGGTLQPQDRAQLVYFLSDYGDEQQSVDAALRQERLPTLLGLLLASPYFQWR